MKSRSKVLLERAVAAMVAAIDVYNKPDFRYRAESFAILALNGWELLLKAKWLCLHNNQLSSLYIRERGSGKRRRYKRGRSGNPLTHSLDYIAKKFVEQKELDEACWKNLEALLELRNTAVHFYHRPQFAERIQEVGIATVKNFVSAVQDWFGEDLSRFNLYLMPLSFVGPPHKLEGVVLNKGERKFVEYLQQINKGHDDPTAKYAVTVNIEVRFVRSKAASAAPVRVTTDPRAPAVRLTEEQLRERYPWEYQELTNRCRERYSDFKVNKDYHQLRKSLESDQRYAHIRRMDPDKPKPKKTFYNPNILQEFDKHYHRR